MDEISKIKKLLSKADYILIGAGAGLSTAAGNTYSGERFEKISSLLLRNTILKTYIHQDSTISKHKKKNGHTGQNISI